MTNRHSIIYFIAISVLAVVLWLCFNKNSHVEVIERHNTDTLYFSRVDTIIEYRKEYITKKTTDTLYIETHDKPILRLPVVQKHYSNTNGYDLWISGVEPLKMDSFKLYPKTEYKTITNEIVKEIYPKRTEIYVFGGLNAFNGTLSPKIGISVKTKENWLISPEIGLYDNKAYYGLTIGKKFK